MKLSRRLARLKSAGPGSQSAPGGPTQDHEFEAVARPAVLGRPFEPEEVEPRGERLSTDPKERVRQARIGHLRGLIADFETRALARAKAEQEARQAALLASGGEPRVLPGERVETPHGPVRLAELLLPPEHCHGKIAVQDGLHAQAQMLARLAFDTELEGLDLSGALFLDTETTGLSGGTGTIPFLVGYARFEEGALKVYQLLLEEPGLEAPMLQMLRDAVQACTVIVTYNGKAYDWPLLNTRFVLNRVPPAPPRPHLDLLHIARRMYRLRLGSARLVTMEEQVLGMRRERDIDGAEIPGVYWSYLRHRDPTQMATVMEHNVNDLVALAALMGVVSQRYAKLSRHDDPRDHLCLARIAERAQDPERALVFARAAAEGGGEPETTTQACLLLADLLKKAGQDPEAAHALVEGLEAAGEDQELAAPLHLALAKLHEHRTKDLAQALQHALHTALEEGQADQERRVLRLERRLARAAERGAAPAAATARARARTGPPASEQAGTGPLPLTQSAPPGVCGTSSPAAG